MILNIMIIKKGGFKMDKVSLVDVKQAYEEKKSNVLKGLINTMENLEQKYIPMPTFLDAYNKNVCECGKVILDRDSICYNCKVAKEEAKKKEFLKQKWIDLHVKLSEFDSDYELKFYDYDIKIKIIKNGHYCSIYRDPIYSSRSFRSYKHALRIDTDDYNIGARRLQGDFNANNIAEKLHNKCNEIFKKFDDIEKRKNEKKNESQNLSKKIVLNFGDDNIENIEKYCYYSGFGLRRRYVKSDAKIVKLKNGFTLRTYDGEKYVVVSYPKSTEILSVARVKDFMSMITTFNAVSDNSK